MNKALKELTNIGVPIYNPIELMVPNMTITCSDNIGKTIDLEREIRQEAIDRVDKLVDKHSLNYKKDYITRINFYADDNSTSVFNLKNQQKILNIFGNLVEIETLQGKDTKEILENLKREKAILSNLINYINAHPYTSKTFSDLKKFYPTLYSGKGGSDLRYYLNNERNYYNSLEKRTDSIENIDFSDLLDDYTNELNPEKVSLYLANRYIDEINTAIITNDTNKQQESLFFLTAFVNNKIDKSIELDLGKKVTYNSIKKEYEAILMKFPHLKEITYKRSFFENKDKNDNISVINSILNMKKVYVKESFVKAGEEPDIKFKDGKHRRKNTPPTEEELRQIQEYLDYKRYVFLKNKPIAQIECPNKFSNYIAFLYENGMMPADRFKNVNTIEQMKADSIYIFDDLTYEEMMQYNKPYLRKNSIIKPLNHSGDWEGRVKTISTMETNEDMRIKAKQMIKINRVN